MRAHNFKDLTGQRFMRLVVLWMAEKRGTRRYWVCQCDCGNVTTVCSSDLTCGNTKSCGCLSREKARDRWLTHGLRGTQAYEAYAHIVQRCTNPKDKAYRYYGARGITCEFISFEKFYAEVGAPPGPDYSIDRKDNNLSYQAGNLRWATRQEQMSNTRHNHLLTYNGETKTMAEWARQVGMNRKVLDRRLRLGWTIEEALTAPVRNNRWLTYAGETLTLTDWARKVGLRRNCLEGRLQRGWSPEEALTLPLAPRSPRPS